VRRDRGDLLGARALVSHARELIEGSADPGSLPVLLEQTERTLAAAPRRRAEAATSLSERELIVLRLLPTRLSTRDISRELSVSVTTIRSQVQSIYRKLQASTRAEAVAHAHDRGLLPESAPPNQ
jgi:LuxR family transcriptional regulator, maltose regulon positive regulatory protein